VLSKIRDKLVDRLFVIFFDCHRQQLIGVCEPAREFIEASYNPLQLRALLPKGLGAIRIVPNVRLFELALDLGQSFRLGLIVKDTPSTHPCAQ
jgi:hypothetical protein